MKAITSAAATFIRRAEQGHADSAGSTIRTLHVVVLLALLMPIFTIAVLRLAGVIGTYIGATP
jgi:hypothetical protein